MPRARYEVGTVKKEGTRRKVWRGYFHVYVDGKRVHTSATLGFCSEMDKGKAKEKLLEEIRKRNHRENPKLLTDATLQEFIEDCYIPTQGRDWGVNTRAAMRSCLKCHVYPVLGASQLKAISKLQIEKHLISLADRQLGGDTLGRVLFLLKAALDEAVENDLIVKNPASKVKLPSCVPPKRNRSLTEYECKLLFSKLEGMDRMLFAVLLETGIRIGEAFALRREDVTDAGLVIDETTLRGRRFGPPKGKLKVRLQPIPAALRKELEMWLETVPEDPRAILFPHKGQAMTRNIDGERILKHLRELTGIKDLAFHMCRRAIVTHAVGVDKDKADLLGHQNFKTTANSYIKSVPERQAAMVEAWDKVLRSGQKRAKAPNQSLKTQDLM